MIRRQSMSQAQSKLDAAEGNGSFRHILELMEEAGMSEEHMLEEIKTMIIAGFETTSGLVHFALLLLALNPEHQAACRKEIDAIFADTKICPRGQLTCNSLPELKYTERCLLETMRHLPIVQLFNRKLESPLKLDEEIELQAGTTVVIAPDLLHSNPEYFPNPEKFEADRFLPENCAKRHPYAFLPFSAGQRNCIGWKFAMMEAKTVVAYVLRHFEIYTSDKLEDVPLVTALLLLPQRDYFFKLVKRNSNSNN